ncbi:hypothetical protein LTR24_003604 [Lithohypha guttulata]|uniref:Aspergillus nuclease S(1) n=1 Tax=Lithohypha guttulata TaxID=1690604 RepID=A0ABR0KER6_9EURO|nr:hypothetical protein LTR24_003604 [Lithohypha guttulata]
MAPITHHLLPLLFTLFTLLPPATPWGSLGHRTTVALSLLHIPPTHPAHALLTTLLHAQDPTTAALFPDRIRYIPSFAYTAPWHYIDALDNPPHQCGISMSRDCLPADGCVVTAIANHTARVADVDLPLWQRGQSMRFMLHFFGDVHQPLHTENLSRGGNDIDVVFDRQKHNLHSVWDTLIPKKVVEIAGEMGVFGSKGRWDLKNETEAAYAWAEFLYASYVMEGGLEELGSKDLGEAYFEGAVPIVEEMIVKGGRRLARWLMMIAQDLAHNAAIDSSEEHMSMQEL